MAFAVLIVRPTSSATAAPGLAQTDKSPVSAASEVPASRPDRFRGLGEVVNLTEATICMPTKDGLDEIVKWAVQRDNQEMARVNVDWGRAPDSAR